jgi:hypothetical protein
MSTPSCTCEEPRRDITSVPFNYILVHRSNVPLLAVQNRDSPCLKPRIEPTRLEFLRLLVSVVMHVIFLSSPSPSPVANIQCVGIYPNNPHPFTLWHIPPLANHPHPIIPSPSLRPRHPHTRPKHPPADQPFPTLTETHEYLRSFARPHLSSAVIRLSTEVVRLEGVRGGGWKVVVRYWNESYPTAFPRSTASFSTRTTRH